MFTIHSDNEWNFRENRFMVSTLIKSRHKFCTEFSRKPYKNVNINNNNTAMKIQVLNEPSETRMNKGKHQTHWSSYKMPLNDLNN